MTMLASRKRHPLASRERERPEFLPRRWWYGVAFLILAGYLLFAHGCHLDKDTELLLFLSR